MGGLKPWPIVLGVLVDLVGSVLVSALYFVILFSTRSPGTELTTADLIAVASLGLLLTAFGGYVAGRKANVLHVRHGAVAGAGALMVWLLLDLVIPSEGIPAWYEPVARGATVPAGALGGYVARRRGGTPS